MKLLKRIVAISLLFVMTLCICSCSKVAKDSNDEIKVDKKILTVDVDFPSDYFEDNVTKEELDQYLTEKGYKKYKINDDGSVTFTMTKKQHKQLLTDMKTSIDEGITDMISGEDASGDIVKVDYDDKVTDFKIYVNPDNYSVFTLLNKLAFFVYGNYYQTFSGVPYDERQVIVTFINNNTGEEIDKSDLQSFRDNNSKSENHYDDIRQASDGNWYYYADDQIDYSYSGTATNENGTWNIENGKVIF